MFQSNFSLPFKIKKSENIYSFKQKLTGRGNFDMPMKKLTSEEDETYKMIGLNPIGVARGLRKRIQKIQKNIHFYQDRSSVPNMVYHDNNSVVIRWIEGPCLHQLDLDSTDYKNFAIFNASNSIEISRTPVEQIMNKRIKQLKKLRELNEIDDNLYNAIIKIFTKNELNHPEYIYESLCFADTSLKNYVQKNDNSLVYIDVFGLDKRGIGRILGKTLSQVPKEHRQTYYNHFIEALNLDGIKINLPFSYLVHLIGRIYSNVTKRTFRNSASRKKKTRQALLDLQSFLKAKEHDKDLFALIMKI